MKRLTSLVIIIVMCMTLSPTNAFASDTPSSWAASPVNAAIAANLVPESLQSNYTQTITRAEFCALAVRLYETVMDRTITERQTFSDTNDINVEKAAAIGVVTGVGNNRFDPNASLTREQAATMLSRLADTIDKPLHKSTTTFDDNNQISSWAIEAVRQMRITGIMTGVGNNTFSPKGPYTREQSILTILRLYNFMPRIQALGLGVIEGFFYLESEKDSIISRLNDYVDIGIKTIIVDVDFSRPSEGEWQISEETKFILEAAAERGLFVKIIPQTIKDPPEWLAADENTRFKDNDGRMSVNVISYWYEDIKEYCESALRSQLEELRNNDLLDAVGAIQVDLGIWGEPVYPASVTQHPMGADGDNFGEEVLWCYGENAVEDFRIKMQSKYSTINMANKAWETNYVDFDTLIPPKPGEVKGQLWEDLLTWYLQTKQDFCDWQVGMYKRVVGEYYEDMPLILYLMGNPISEAVWKRCIRNGATTWEMILGYNDLSIDLAVKYDCLLEFTGFPYVMINIRELSNLGIPVFGENPGSIHDNNDPETLIRDVIYMGLNGLEYQNARYLYESDGMTKGRYFYSLRENIEILMQGINNPIPWNSLENKSNPEGDIIQYDVTFNTTQDNDYAYTFTRIATPDYTIAEGDILEYDVKLPVCIAGIGAIDGLIGGETIRDNDSNIDQNRVQAHPGSDLAEYAFNQWYRRELNISNAETIGKKLTEIQLATHPMDAYEFSGITATIWYDNIRITNNGEVKLVIFESAEDIDLSQAELVEQRNATANVSIVNVSDAG